MKNLHNYTEPVNIFPIDKVEVGNYSYGPLKVYSYVKNDSEKLIIGSFCSIANGVKFLLGGNHDLQNYSTYPFNAVFLQKEEAVSKGTIIIDDEVWIGTDAIILSGVHLPQGCVVAAGSVVAKSFKPYSIVGGNPAKLIRYRFDEQTIEELLKIKPGNFDKKFIIDNMDLFYNKNLIFFIEKSNKLREKQ